MTLETVALLAFLSVNLKVIFLALPSHVSPQRLRITFCYIWRFISFFYIVLYCIDLHSHNYYRTRIRNNFQWPWTILTHTSMAHPYWTLNISETVQDRQWN